MIRHITLAAAISIGATAAFADAPRDQLLASVARDLPHYVPGVDVSTLSRHQLASLHMILHNSDSGSNRIAMIRSVLGGPYSLRGLLFDK